MAKQYTRDKFPDRMSYERVMKASLILIASAEIALDQLYTIKDVKSNFYRQGIKGTLNKTKETLEPYVEEFVNFHKDPDEETEKVYYQITRMIESFTEILADLPGEQLGTLDMLLNNFKNGDFKTVSEEEFALLSSKESKLARPSSDDSEIGGE